VIALDTNVLSHLMAEDPVATRWFRDLPSRELGTTAIARAEIRVGVASLPPGKRRQSLQDRADQILALLADRTLPLDSAAADAYGNLMSDRRRTGRPMPLADAQIAAICLARDAALATRNVKDFEGCGLTLINPFD